MARNTPVHLVLTTALALTASHAFAREPLSGAWDSGSAAFVDSAKDDKGNICVLMCGKPLSEEQKAQRAATMTPDMPPYKPELLPKVAKLKDTQVTTDPALRCGNPGLPRIGVPDQIIEAKGRVIFLYDDLNGSFWRIVRTDSRKHRPDAEASLLGDSVGWWEGDTFVVEATRFDDSSWLTDNGAFHSDKLKVTERLTRKGDRLFYEATIEDPEVLTGPWHKRARVATLMENDLLEPPPCVEQSFQNMKDLSDYHANPR